jgi:hypothetical protein
MSTDLKTSNNYLTNLSNTISAGDTSITVNDASGLPDLPDDNSFTYLTLISKTDSSQEIVRVNDITGNVLTVERGQEDTVAKPFDEGDEVRNFFTSGMFQYLASLTSGSNPGLTKYITITEITGTSYTVLDSDSASLLVCTSDDDVTLTWEAGYTSGHQVGIMQAGTGTVTCSAGSGVTFSDAGTVATLEQGSMLTSVNYATDSYNFIGEQVGAPIIGSIETADRTITIEATDIGDSPDDTWANIQDKLNGVGGFIEQGVMITIDWENGTYDIGANLLRMPDFSGGGFVLCKAENATGPNTSVKNVNIIGDGSNVYSNFSPYNTIAEDENYLVSCVGSNLVVFGDIGFTLRDDGSSTGNSGTVFGGFCQLSFEDCWINNEVSTGTISGGILAYNTATVNGNGNQIDVVVGHSSGIAAGVVCGGGGTAGIIRNHTGSGDYTFYSTNTGTIAYYNNSATAAIATEYPNNGGWYLPTDKAAIYA